MLDVAVEQQNARGVALEGRAIEVAFHAEDEWAGLPIVTGLNTAKKAGEGLDGDGNGKVSPRRGTRPAKASPTLTLVCVVPLPAPPFTPM